MRRQYIIAVVSAVLCLLVFLSLLFVFGFFDVIYAEIQLRRPSLYKPLTQDMAALVSHIKNISPDRYIRRQDIGELWQPESLKRMPENYVLLNPEVTVIVFGGGFYPLSYHLVLNSKSSNENKTVWDLYIAHEHTGPKIYTYHLPKEDKVVFNKIMENAIAQYDKNIADNPQSEDYKTEKMNFMQLFENSGEKE